MSAKGCCWENAVVESFFSTLKLELNLDDNRRDLVTLQQLQRELAFWIESHYNRERRHSKIGYLSPIDYEQQYLAARTLILRELLRPVHGIGGTPGIRLNQPGMLINPASGHDASPQSSMPGPKSGPSNR